MTVETIADGRYRVERVLGEGAMAKVLLAHDAELGREVAVKLLDEGLAADPSFRARFAREARVAHELGPVGELHRPADVPDRLRLGSAAGPRQPGGTTSCLACPRS